MDPAQGFFRSTLLYGFESPHYHRIRFDEMNPFSGWVLPADGRQVSGIRVLEDREQRLATSVDRDRPDLAQLLPSIPAAGRSGFRFDLGVPAQAKRIELRVEMADGSCRPFVVYDLRRVRSKRPELLRMAGRIDALPLPEESLVRVTQGIADVRAYRESIVSGAFALEEYLEQTGRSLEGKLSVLDFGCGSGRILTGLWARNPSLGLFGCDINPQLVEWSIRNLPREITFRQNSPDRPIPFENRQFDLILLISVFTHLSLPTQKRLAAALSAVLSPGGHIVLSLHGEPYVWLAYGANEEKESEFQAAGYVERSHPDEGSNDFCTFHAPWFVPGLFPGLELKAVFPRGSMPHRGNPFPIAGLQDVYVLENPVDPVQ